MSPLLVLLLLLFAARAGGEIALRVGQSSMLGEILAGLVLGPTVLSLAAPDRPVELLSRLGILFLMFLAGLHVDLDFIRKVAGRSVIVSLVGSSASFALGYLVGLLFGLGTLPSIFLAAALSASSIVVTTRVLGEYGMIRSRVGLLAMATNAVDDIVSMLVVLLVASVAGRSETGSIWWMFGKLALYSIAAAVVGLLLLRPLMRLVGTMRSDQMYFSVAVLLVLLFSWSADALGLADVLGAFVIGAFLQRTEGAGPGMITRMEALADGFLVPIFFASMGLRTNLRELAGHLPLLGVALLAAIAGKLVGCGGAARLTGYGWRESYIVGAGMVPRAEITLVLLGIGLSARALPPVLPPLLIAIVFLSAVLTAPMLRLGLRGIEEQQVAAGS